MADLHELLALNAAHERISNLSALDARHLADQMRTSISDGEIRPDRMRESVETLHLLDRQFMSASGGDPDSPTGATEENITAVTQLNVMRYRDAGDEVMAQRYEALLLGITDQSKIEEPENYVKHILPDL